ncbi:MAG: hypothetical protein H7Y59_18960 [Anaerolineales bacterium]|nr:hypothetical protein [Anaerolineales bacterium]
MDFAPTPVFYIFIGLIVGMLVGWGIGFFDSNSRTAKKIDIAEAKAVTAMMEADRKIAAAQAKLPTDETSTTTIATAADNPGLLRLKNDNNGRFVVEMDGGPIPDVLSPDKKKRLIELITVFRPWLEGGQPLQAAAPSNTSSQTPPTPASVQQTASPLPPISSAKPVDEKAIRSLSIVAQIDTVLQRRLIDTSLATRGIRLTESTIGSVEVYVGLNKYPSIDDVPDLEIKDAIRAAIAEWEQKYIPGM